MLFIGKPKGRSMMISNVSCSVFSSFMVRVCYCGVCSIAFWFAFFCHIVTVYISQIHCGSAIVPGTRRSPHYCAPLVYVLNFQRSLRLAWRPGLQCSYQPKPRPNTKIRAGGLAMWLPHRQTNNQTMHARCKCQRESLPCAMGWLRLVGSLK